MKSFHLLYPLSFIIKQQMKKDRGGDVFLPLLIPEERSGWTALSAHLPLTHA